MPRDIPIGNGSLLVNFDGQYRLRDLYWPYVGMENHTAGHPFRFGVWVDGRFCWISDEGWDRALDYAQDTLVTEVKLYHSDLALSLSCNDVVDFHENIYLRRMVVENQTDRPRQVRIFFNHDFHISNHAIGDTAYYEPERLAVFHYKGKRWFLANVAREISGEWQLGVDQWAVGDKEAKGRQGTWRDAEDGQLSGNPIAQGSVDSTLALHLDIPEGGQATCWYWIAVGEKFEEVTRLNRIVRRKGPEVFLDRSRDYWSLWCTKELDSMETLPVEIRKLYRRSLLILRTQIDNQGAILAANDFDITRFGRDTYSYMWPRDGALVAGALIDAGYSEVTRRFFDFCHRVITEEGYLLHKYNPDGSLASSWHPWYVDGRKQLPVQEDETALVLWALWRHFDRFRDIEFVKPHFRGLVMRAADWMVNYRDPDSGLPCPSWDLWEEQRGVHAWTMSTTWAGLQAAASFAHAFGEDEAAARYRRASDEIRAAAETHLWSPDQERFVSTIKRNQVGEWDLDLRVDASLVGLWAFGMFDPTDPRIVATMNCLREQLWVKTDVGGMARYENDKYHQVSQDADRVPGNPWFICTLWLAQWHIASAQRRSDLEPALDLLHWASDHALPSGVMAEQIHPFSDRPLSVSPLTWSHATLVSVVQQYMEKMSQLDS
jgi:oligosaccharide amylase